MQFPSFSQWKQIFKVLKQKEKITLLCFFLLAVASFGFLSTDFYIAHTKATPTLGGTYIEGIVGQPRFINPIYGETNDIDRSMIDLVFSGLMTYDNQGHITNDLVDNYHISDDGKAYTFQLKDNIFWHDGKPLTADDVIFTIKTIQNSDYKSPLRANWIDVETQKVSDKSFALLLRSPYNSFLENCTLKIIPKHVWEAISPENFALSLYNLQPIGSGPFAFSELTQTNTGFIKTLRLTSHRKYHNQPSFISSVTFEFFEKKEDLIISANAGKVNGFTLSSLEDNEADAEKLIQQNWSNQEKFSTYSFNLPRYFAVFFNLTTISKQKTNIFSDSNVRQGLSYAINKNDLIETISTKTKNTITNVDSPILPDFFNYQEPLTTYGFDIDKANALLDKAGYKKDETGLRSKAIAKTPAFQFKSYLKIGSKGTEVKQLQLCLARLDENFKNALTSDTDGVFGKGTDSAVTEFQKKYLPDLKPTGETGESTRKKLNELCTTPSANTQPLKFTLTTVNQPQILEVASMLKDYWQTVGVSVDINPVSITDLKPIIKNRNYEALLYGEALGAEPDLYPFWHSSQRIDPGLNLSAYENKTVDQLLKEARETLDQTVKIQKLEKLQNAIINDAPAIFLYNPHYIYWVSDKIQGIDTEKIIDPAKRFSNITNWFINTKRIWK